MMSTGRMDKNGVEIEEMDYVSVPRKCGFEYGLIIFDKTYEEFVFANDYMVVPLSDYEDDEITVMMKHSKIDELVDKLFEFNPHFQI